MYLYGIAGNDRVLNLRFIVIENSIIFLSWKFGYAGIQEWIKSLDDDYRCVDSLE